MDMDLDQSVKVYYMQWMYLITENCYLKRF